MSNRKRIVIKIGTSTLTHESGHIHIRRFEELIKVLADLQNGGIQLILVSSGAIAVGMGKVGLRQKPSDIPGKQACAAIGQCELMHLYDVAFGRFGHDVAQLLLTKDIIEDPNRVCHVQNTLEKLLEMQIIPIINENDTIAIEEIVFGDNDTLSAIVSVLADADGLIILSDIDGLYTANPRTDQTAQLIPRVDLRTERVDDLAEGVGTSRGTGGMITKLQAAKLCHENDIPMWIMNSADTTNLYRWFDGKPVGTYFVPKGEKDDKRLRNRAASQVYQDRYGAAVQAGQE